MKRTSAILAALLLGLGGTGVAQQTPAEEEAARQGETPPQERPFKFRDSFWDIDANQDGAIDPDEVQGHWDVVERWTELDVDGNGKIEREEFAAFEQGTTREKPETPPLP
jgi:hypothetical protein